MVRLRIGDGKSRYSLEVDTSIYMDDDDCLETDWETESIFISHYELSKHPHSLSKPEGLEITPIGQPHLKRCGIHHNYARILQASACRGIAFTSERDVRPRIG